MQRRTISWPKLDDSDDVGVVDGGISKNKSLPSVQCSVDCSSQDEIVETCLVLAFQPPRKKSPEIMTISDGLHRQPLGPDVETLRHNMLSIDLYEDFGVFHRCLRSDDDPFVGLVSDFLLEGKCCVMRAFLDYAHNGTGATVVNPESENGSMNNLRNKPLTAYGEKLQRINALVYEIDIRLQLHDFWRLNGCHLNAYLLFDFVQEIIPGHFDEDGVRWFFGPCSVCANSCRYVRQPPCCHATICQPCWSTYVQNYSKTSLGLLINGVYDLHCFSCSQLVPYSQALSSTNPSDMQLIRPHLARSSTTRCPVCLKVPYFENKDGGPSMLELMQKSRVERRRKKGGQPIRCDRCHHIFCAFCGTADHPKLSCHQLTGSEVGLRKWTREKSAARPDFPNGRFCPVCHIPVSHSGGCPQMVCPCGAEFCYLCGRKYCKSVPFLLPGHKSSRYIPIISCPKLWKSQSKRIAVHSIIGLGLVVGLGPIALAVSPFVIPAAVGFYMMERSRRRRRDW